MISLSTTTTRRQPRHLSLGPVHRVLPMSQGFHHGVLDFSHGFGRSAPAIEARQHQQHIAQQSRRDKLRVLGFDPPGTPLLPIEEREEPIFEPATAGNMLSDMFDFTASRGPSAADLLADQMPGDWYRSDRHGGAVVVGRVEPGLAGDITKLQQGRNPPQYPLSELSVDSAAAMQLFLTNPAQLQPRSPSPPSPPRSSFQQSYTGFQSPSFGNSSFAEGVVRGQGLSLSLSPSLHQLEMAKAPELRLTEGFLSYGSQYHYQQQPWQLQGHPGQVISHAEQVHRVSYGGSVGAVSVLRHSRYSRAAKELLEEFCSVGRGQLKKGMIKARRHASPTFPNPSASGAGSRASTSTAGSPSSTKVPPPPSPAERFEHQRRKTKLLPMLDEVDRRYNHYRDKMQVVVNSFDSAMGFGAAVPYTALAEKAMSRHFRCLKEAIAAQLKQTCQLLGEKDERKPSGITKGETPRLRLLDQTLRRQRAFHQMGVMEQDGWRPQRGLPERSVNILRAWLFEHFLHPYPSDADKHFLARQTGLSRNQVSNWFINARVRLWKPMVEEMYKQEAMEAAEAREIVDGRAQSPAQELLQKQQPQLQQPETHAAESNQTEGPPSSAVRRQQQRLATLEGASAKPPGGTTRGSGDIAALVGMEVPSKGELWELDRHVVPMGDNRGGVMEDYSAAAMAVSAVTLARAGASGDVSLTLGLRHAGNMPATGGFMVRDIEDH